MSSLLREYIEEANERRTRRKNISDRTWRDFSRGRPNCCGTVKSAILVNVVRGHPKIFALLIFPRTTNVVRSDDGVVNYLVVGIAMN